MSAAASRLELSDDQRADLLVMSKSTSLPHRKVIQARALLDAGDGIANEVIARRHATKGDTVRRWRARFVRDGAGGVGVIAPGRGRKAWLPDGTVAAVVTDTRTAVPDDDATCWSTRTLAARHGIGKDSVARIWQANRLKPWRVDGFKLSNDPDFENKVEDIVGLYMNPPECAAVFSFDEKTQVQALDRTQPSLPMIPGRGRTMTHDYKRNGTTDLFAAMNIATGEVLYDPRKTHTCKDVLAFFKIIDLHVPAHLDVHVVLDNLSAHKGPEVRTWLADPKRARWHLHFTPTSSSWLNLVSVNRLLVLDPHTQTPHQQCLPQCSRPQSRHRALDRTLERQPETLRLDQNSTRHHRLSPTRTSPTQLPHQFRDRPLASIVRPGP